MAAFVVLLPPSEGKADGGRRGAAPDRFASSLGSSRIKVLEALRTAMATSSEVERSKLLRVRGALLDRALVATQGLIDGDPLLLPAWKRYDGVVWDFLDPGTLTARARARILVPSAIYGLTTAQDHIADYRLGMQCTLPGIGNLARFWRSRVTDLIRPTRRTTVLDLLTKEHRSAIDWQGLGPTVHVDFVQAEGAGAAGHVAKAAKGRFARHVIEHGLEEALSFSYEGWTVRRSDAGFLVAAPK